MLLRTIMMIVNYEDHNQKFDQEDNEDGDEDNEDKGNALVT